MTNDTTQALWQAAQRRKLAAYVASYIGEELERGQEIHAATVSDAIEAFEAGAYDCAVYDVKIECLALGSEAQKPIEYAAYFDDMEKRNLAPLSYRAWLLINKTA